jgi:hypothetical protein
VAVLASSVDCGAGRVQDRAAKSCFINDMVKKHLPVTKLRAHVGEQNACCQSVIHRTGGRAVMERKATSAIYLLFIADAEIEGSNLMLFQFPIEGIRNKDCAGRSPSIEPHMKLRYSRFTNGHWMQSAWVK